jgi:hypothetical protein
MRHRGLSILLPALALAASAFDALSSAWPIKLSA